MTLSALLTVTFSSIALTSCKGDVLPGGFVTPSEGFPADAIRITGLGTGTPDVRKNAVATSYLIQLGNGDNFLFDLGTGSYLNLLATGISQDVLTKVASPSLKLAMLASVESASCNLRDGLVQVFISHLHSDHIADLASLYIGAMFGRRRAWEVWGPSGPSPDLGISASLQGLRQFMAWDTVSRRKIDLVGREDDGDQVIAHEFAYNVPNQLIYSANGVNITSTPVDHYVTDGPVALRLDWNGLSVTYSGDTRPTQTLTDLANLRHGSDVLLLQNMGPILDFAGLPKTSQYLLNTSHITPQQAGGVISAIKPRLAAVHHLTVNDASRVAIVSDIRVGYPEGALHIAEDLDTFEVTRERITIRKRLVPHHSWGYWHSDGEGVHAARHSGLLPEQQ